MGYNYDPTIGKAIMEPGENEANKSLIFGILGIFVFGLVFGILAIVYAKKATEEGLYNSGKVLTGKILGWISVIWGILSGLIIVAAIALPALLAARQAALSGS